MNSLKVLKKILYMAQMKKGSLIVGVLCLMASSASALLIPRFLGQLLESLDEGMVSEEVGINTIVSLIAALIVNAVFTYLYSVAFSGISANSLTRLRQRAFSHMIKLPLTFFKKRSVTELTSRISSDIQILQKFFESVIPTLANNTIIIVGGLAMMLIISWQLTLIVLLIVPVFILVYSKFGGKIQGTSEKLQSDTANANVLIQESFADIYAVKSFNREFFQIDKFNRTTDSVTSSGMKLGEFQARFSLFSSFCVAILILGVIGKGSLMVHAGTLSTGQIVSFAGYMVSILLSVLGVSSILSEVGKGVGSASSIINVMKETGESLGERSEITLSGGFRFENVSFSYPSNPNLPVLKNISFSVPKGERWALVGTSGSGKSTIAALLLQMYPPNKGKIFFDDHSTDELSITDIRSHISVVPQSSTLFSGTIRENILFGRPDAAEEEFIEVAIESSVDEFVKDLPEKYETIVGEQGQLLSGGQRQRILLARAMLNQPRILVLDEATSALDSETEMLVQVAIYLLTKKCTSLMIAHRLSTVKTADRILVLEKGEIIEQGSYDELMADERSHFRHLNFLSVE